MPLFYSYQSEFFAKKEITQANQMHIYSNQCHMIHYSPRELQIQKNKLWSVLCYSWANLSESRIQKAN